MIGLVSAMASVDGGGNRSNWKWSAEAVRLTTNGRPHAASRLTIPHHRDRLLIPIEVRLHVSAALTAGSAHKPRHPQNRMKVPISRPAAKDQSPKVQTEMTRTRSRCCCSYSISVMAAALPTPQGGQPAPITTKKREADRGCEQEINRTA
jgi:hypothetical protein